MQHHYADINGLRMHYVTHGAGDPIVFLHGFPEYWGAWKKELNDLGKDHHVIAPDLRGYNLTSKPEKVEDYHIKHLVEDVRSLVEHLGLKKTAVVCQDWGALVGWSFLLRHPELVSRFVTINITHPALFDRELRENPRQQLAAQYMLVFNSPQAEPQLMGDDFAWAKQAVINDARAHGAILSDEDVAEWISAWKQPGSITSGLNYYRAAKMAPPDGEGHPGGSNLLDGLKPDQYLVRVPVLFIHGEQDTYLLADGQRGLKELVPQLTIRRIPDATHWVALEKPREVSQFIREFMRG
ncbi:alpha/beta fold hydrolase [Vitiosangium sp. GDMCC 1.1324]|uniref:alpha/beta fold hydrolase n=1 Tax=Vitiosangium sp. (strain GDMCC 1.1324) TaxID=2138576 RepID=UPI000D341967|nr:alpha/beta hydrolase [Vitiosangium sp. GDMCC 1.1324]PTL78321.1 alpha/beta hydrolase [Vitiosangium sp. GDMCC 1.1324]